MSPKASFDTFSELTKKGNQVTYKTPWSQEKQAIVVVCDAFKTYNEKSFEKEAFGLITTMPLASLARFARDLKVSQ